MTAEQLDVQSDVRPPARRKARLSGWRVALAVAVLGLALVWIEHATILRQLAGWWAVSDDLVHADAVVVLGGDLEVRPFAAAALYKHGFADKVLVSNVFMGKAERLGMIPSHTELNRDVLLKLGVPESAIVTIGNDNSSTFDEAEAVRAWGLRSGAKAVIVPTELFAARRTRWIFHRVLDAGGIAVIVRAFPPPDYGLEDWWRNRHGLVDFNNEILKYLYYRAKY
jgi:uncharacterized SAM-binding protein YcdF (DUF218 family)